jgi:hypothetical protein
VPLSAQNVDDAAVAVRGLVEILDRSDLGVDVEGGFEPGRGRDEAVGVVA